MPDTFIKIASVTVGSGGASTIQFSSIPSTYTDLCLKVSGRVDAAGNYQSMAMAFNAGSPASAFSQRWVNGNGSAVASGSYGANTTLYPFYLPAAGATSSTFGSGEIYVCNYANTSVYKAISIDGVTETNATDARAELGAMLWSSNNAVSSITLYGNTNFVQYSTATLYGIKNS